MIDTNAIRSAHLDPGLQKSHYAECELYDEYCAIAALCDEVDRLRAELHRWQHGEQIESDYVCRPALELQAEVDRLRAELQAERAMRLAATRPIAPSGDVVFVEYRGDTK